MTRAADRQSSLAAELINKDEIDLMLGQATVGVGIAQQCELNGVPCITTRPLASIGCSR
ncbi:MAG: hypothetical protein R3E42_13475 [Burkholderiaceae bacterium]